MYVPKYILNRLNITCSRYNAEADPLFKVMDILKLRYMLDLNAPKFYYKYRNVSLPSNFSNFNFVTQGAHHSHDTRQRDQMRTKWARTNYASRRLKIYLILLLKSTPKCILDKILSHSLHGFSSYFKLFKIKSY